MQAMRVFHYWWSVLKMAFSHSLTPAQDVVFVLFVAAGILSYFVPAIKTKMPFDASGWEVAKLVLGSIVLGRILMAPYWLHKADQEKLYALQATIETLSNEDSKKLTDEDKRRLKLLSSLKILYVRKHALKLSDEFMSGLENVPPEWINEQLRQRGETWQWNPKAPTGDSTPQYIPDRDTELDSAMFLMALRSAWGRWYSAQILAGNGTPIRDDHLMRMAADCVVHEAVEGNLVIRGRPASGTEYETIAPEVWRLAHLDVKPDPMKLWRISAIPRSDVNPERISRLLSYDSLIVDSRQFEGLWPAQEATADTQRRQFLQKARKIGADPAEIAKLSDH